MERFVLCRDSINMLIIQLFRYHEKTIQQKLEILYQRDYYVLAISLGQKASLDINQRNIILRKYGDFLYQKGDYDTAMQQYLKAIDNTEPSQVIRKVWHQLKPTMHEADMIPSFLIHNVYIISLSI